MNRYGEGVKDSSGHHCSDDRDEIEVLELHIKVCSKRLDNNNIFSGRDMVPFAECRLNGVTIL